MSLLRWPFDDLTPRLSNLEWQTEDNRILSDMDDGEPNVRVLYDNPLTRYRATFRGKNHRIAAMQGFIKHSLSDGSKWLYMPLRTELGIIEHEVFFEQRPDDGRPLGTTATECGAVILVRNKQTMSEIDVLNEILSPNNVSELNQALEDAWENWS